MKWIKVEDKLPEATRTHKWQGPISDQVLCAIKCTTKKGTRYVVKEGHYAHRYNSWSVPGSQHEVIAWMSMPEYKENNTEDLGNIIKYIVNKLTIKGFSVGCYCIDNCINTYVQRGEYYLKNIISLTSLDEVEDKQYYIDYFINSIIEQFNGMM